MNSIQLSKIATFFILLSALLTTDVAGQSTRKDKRILTDSKKAKTTFIQTDPSMKNLFDHSYAYVIFPNVGKAGFGVGGASGNGTVFKQGKAIGSARLTQMNVGFQMGVQSYREVIFFETKESLDQFKENRLEVSAQVSAVIAASGASASAKYSNGILIFTHPKGGLMYEATVGGQTFSFKAY